MIFQNNRPFYGKKICIIIPDANKLFTIRCLPRWLEQIYENLQIIIVNNSNYNLYSDIKKILTRYALDIYYKEIPENAKIGIVDTLEEAFEQTNAEVISICPSDCAPLPYYSEIIMSALEKDCMIKCGKSSSYPSNFIDSNSSITIKINDYFLYTSNETEMPRCAIFIPVMNREENFIKTFPNWLQQTYQNLQIVIIDYNSDTSLENSVTSICKEYQKTLSYNVSDYNSDVILFRLENLEFFNISHAYNYAISRIETDVVSLACADSVPWDFYIDLCMNMINEENLIQIHWGLHTITKNNWKKLNGHQEFIVGWGAEDDDFRIRATLMGLKVKILHNKFVFQIPQTREEKVNKRQIQDLSESSLTNQARFNQYIAVNGYVGNYEENIGQEKPIEYKLKQFLEKTTRLLCFKSDKLDKKNPNHGFLYNEEFDLFYIITDAEINCEEYTSGPYWHYYVQKDSLNIEKYLRITSKT